MDSKHVKRCSTSLIRETQIKTTMRYNLTPVRMVITQKTESNTCWQEGREIGILGHSGWEYKMVQLLWKKYAVFKKLKT